MASHCIRLSTLSAVTRLPHPATKLQSWLIARCQAKMINLQTRAMSTIIGQGGSGGAIAQLAHKRFMLALSMYAVISPEGCAAILFRQVNDDTIARALEVLQPTAEHMRQYGIVHEIIPEPALDDADYVAHCRACQGRPRTCHSRTRRPRYDDTTAHAQGRDPALWSYRCTKTMV